jgi:hypothetical protein
MSPKLSPGRVAVLLVSTDLLLVYLHRARWQLGWSWRWALDVDGSIPEIYGYAKVAMAGLLLMEMYRRSRTNLLLGWALALALGVIDDAFQLHERGGEWFAELLQQPSVSGLRPQDVGELLAWGVLGAAVAAGLCHLHRREHDPWSRLVSWRLAAVVTLLAAFAVGVDLMHQVVPAQLDNPVTVLEDGGELLVQSLLLVYVVVERRAGARACATRDRAVVPARATSVVSEVSR